MTDTNNNDDIVWGDPGPVRGGGGGSGRLAAFVDALKSRPGEWAAYPRPVTPAAVTNNKMRYPGTEWTSRKHPTIPHKVTLYGKWVGTEEGGTR